jgi:anti-anti-sigma factor
MRRWIVSFPGHVEVESRVNGAVWVVVVHGDFDSDCRPTLEQTLAIVDRAARVIIDLSPARFIDSSVLRVLARHARPGSNRGGRLVIVAPPGGFPRKLIDASGLIEWTRIFGSAEAALRAVGAPRAKQAAAIANVAHGA